MSISDFYNCSDFSDAFVKYNDKTIFLHKVILAQVPYFKTMFSNFELDKNVEIDTTQIPVDITIQLKFYQMVYGIPIDTNSLEEILQLFIISDYMNCSNIKKIIEDTFEEVITPIYIDNFDWNMFVNQLNLHKGLQDIFFNNILSKKEISIKSKFIRELIWWISNNEQHVDSSIVFNILKFINKYKFRLINVPKKRLVSTPSFNPADYEYDSDL